MLIKLKLKIHTELALTTIHYNSRNVHYKNEALKPLCYFSKLKKTIFATNAGCIECCFLVTLVVVVVVVTLFMMLAFKNMRLS